MLSGFVENGASLNSFLFGSIVSISEGELALVVVISVLVLAAVLFFTGNCFISALMKMRQGSPVFPCGILIFFYYSDGSDSFHCVPYSRDLIVSSMLVVPVACGMQMAKSYKGTLICAKYRGGMYHHCRTVSFLLCRTETRWNDRSS